MQLKSEIAPWFTVNRVPFTVASSFENAVNGTPYTVHAR